MEQLDELLFTLVSGRGTAPFVLIGVFLGSLTWAIVLTVRAFMARRQTGTVRLY